MWYSSLSWHDYTFIIAYFLATLCFVRTFKSKKHSKIAEYFLAGRQLTLPMFVGTMVATWYGQIAGVSELSYSSGVYNWLTQAFFWYCIYAFFAIFIADKIQKQNSDSLPQYLHQHYGSTAGHIAAWVNFIKMIPIIYLLSLALILKMLFALSLFQALLLGAFFSSIYCFFGGYRAVVYSDCFQMILMYVGILLVPCFAYRLFGGWEYLKLNLPPSHLQLMGEHSYSETVLWAIIPLTTLVNPTFFQRCLSAGSPKTVKKGLFLCIMFWAIFDICTTLIGLYARASLPNIDPKEAIFLMGMNLLPQGLKGVYIVGMLATLMSTIDSHCLMAGQIFAQDLYPRIIKKKLSPTKIISMSRIGMGIVLVLAIVMNTYFSFTITFYRKFMGSLATVCLLIPLLLALLCKDKKNIQAGIYAMFGGVLGYVWVWILKILDAQENLSQLTLACYYLLAIPKHLCPVLFQEPLFWGLSLSFLAYLKGRFGVVQTSVRSFDSYQKKS